MTRALAINKQVFGPTVGDLTKVFGSYTNDLTSFWHHYRRINTVFDSYANYLTVLLFKYFFLVNVQTINSFVFSRTYDVIFMLKCFESQTANCFPLRKLILFCFQNVYRF